MSEFVVVLVTVGSADEAERLAEAVVSEQLAACVNIVGPIRSIYMWKGELQRDDERLLVLKTRAVLFPALERRVRELHSYETPEVVALPVTAGSAAYLEWLGLAVRGEP
jgi:periplasmic divalent cation tolerance protein